MDLKAIIAGFKRNGAAIEAAYEDVSIEGVRWKPNEKKWSLSKYSAILRTKRSATFEHAFA